MAKNFKGETIPNAPEPLGPPGSILQAIDAAPIPDDTAALRARIAELEAQLAAKGAQPSPPAAGDADTVGAVKLPFRVELKDAPTREVHARDTANAWDVYRRTLGILGSQNTPVITPLATEPAGELVS